MNNSLNFNLGDKISICHNEYTVLGMITFTNEADECTYYEYKIKSKNNGKIKWLSIDETYEEYGLYTKHILKIKLDGYTKKDYGKAKVVNYKGSVDVDLCDIVHYTEYEDITETKIISIEEWEDEVEYSSGVYIEKEDIELLYRSTSPYEANIPQINIKHILVLLVFIIGGAISAFVYFNVGKTPINEFLSKEDSHFVYTTSITSDLNSKEKANVYNSDLSIDETAKSIIEGIKGNVKDVQQNQIDQSIVILTDNEYSIVYNDIENKILVHNSTRKFAYSSTNTLYNATEETDDFYRNYYYNYALSEDTSKYSSNTNGYGSSRIYRRPMFSSDNYYNDYSSSVRQSSINTRNSSGGGTSSGK